MIYSRDDFDFKLPTSLIAQHPLLDRTASRLLCLNRATGVIEHCLFKDLPTFLHTNDLLVFNNTKVIPARLFGYKETGGKIECLVERIISPTDVLVHLRASKTPRIGSTLILSRSSIIDGIKVNVKNKQDSLFHLTLPSDSPVNFFDIVNQYGHMPLPPYIKREDMELDQERYQTVYAKKAGAIAAPTAGLHFDDAILKKIAQKGIAATELTLHVGSGTFAPVRVKDLAAHIMHKEYFELSADNCNAIKQTQQQNGRIVAVGTTVVRTLETVTQQYNTVLPSSGDTQLFITPGFEFQCTNALLTNFHLPKSTLLMLVSAFAGYDLTMKAYQAAVDEKYRFFSYGDAMFIF